MKQFAFVDWDLVRSSPMKHTYRCGWRELVLGGRINSESKRPLRRHLTIEWDGRDHLTVRSGRLWSFKSRWASDDLKGIVFGIRELAPPANSSDSKTAWLWFIRLTARLQSIEPSGVLAEFLVAKQFDAPSTSHARVPARVQELLNWLKQCTGHRVHGPILVTDEDSRKRILSNID